ncbi:hypothetical protein J5U21_01524 [Saccharolobus shibatae]|uniref:Uncharacterized protein n=1 Tax=Saccharolobus shibatae TaxID=2286 RepID=A0A8F5GW71_9CREN|nr:hypothetical protein J5U21_01524 [Saccharolobus shibatae]
MSVLDKAKYVLLCFNYFKGITPPIHLFLKTCLVGNMAKNLLKLLLVITRLLYLYLGRFTDPLRFQFISIKTDKNN